MRHVAQFARTELAHADAVTASIQSWLLEFVVWFLDFIEALEPAVWRCRELRRVCAETKRMIVADLRRSTGSVRRMLVLRAIARFQFTTGRLAPFAIPRGVRAGIRAGSRGEGRIWRIASAGIVARMHDGSLRERAARLRKMLDNPAALIARILKKLYAIWRAPHGPGLVLVASREPCVRLAGYAPLCADSS